MIPIIAAEPAAVRRELLIGRLREYTGLSYQAISSDVNSIRFGQAEERKNRLLAAAERHKLEVEADPGNILAAMSIYEQEVQLIEQDYERDIIGVNYQLSRYDALQQLKEHIDGERSRAGFSLNYFHRFQEVMSGGMIWSTGTLIYIAGKANSGKTAVAILLGLDVLLSDQDTIVLMHFTDDSYDSSARRTASTIYR